MSLECLDGSQHCGTGTPRRRGALLGIPPAERACSSSTLAIGAKPGDHTKPFNIASYALLTHMLAQQCGLEAGEFVWTRGDCHLYSNHLAQAEEQLRRTPGALPTLEIVRRPPAIDGYEYEDLVLHDYVAQPHIKAAVAV